MSSDFNIPPDNFSSQPEPPRPEQIAVEEEKHTPVENPVWSGWDVLLIALITVVLPSLLLLVTVNVVHKFFYPAIPLRQLGEKPILGLTAELTAYVILLCFMVVLIEGKYQTSFMKAIRWNWPWRWWNLVGLGVILLFAIQGLGHVLPMPKGVPFDKYFGNTRDAYLTSIFAISFGPFMEEILFRGLLYPVLARRIGMLASIVITGIAFGMIHSIQLGFSWGPVLLICIVGIVLTTVRAVKKSVAASLIVHIAYNSTLTVLTFAITSGFRHLDKMMQ